MEQNTKSKKKSKIWIIVGCLVVAALAVQYFAEGTAHGDKKANKILQELKADSVALQGNLSPVGKNYTHPQDVSDAVEEIYDLGNPLRYHTSDSAFWGSDPRTAALVKYNKDKCREVLNETLPQWRRAYALALGQTQGFVVNLDGDNDDVIKVYSKEYIDKDKIKSAYTRYGGAMRKLGFKEAIFGFSPNTPATSYDLQ